MRYYYKRKELVIVRRKLVYRFGPKAAIWQKNSKNNSSSSNKSIPR